MKRKLLGLLILLLGASLLLSGIMHDYNIDLGPFAFLYDFFEWFSISRFVEFIISSFMAIFNFIIQYLWAFIFICLGMALLFGSKRQEQYDHSRNTNSVLCRNLDDMKLAGVCSGLAHTFGIDPTIVRIIALFLAFSSAGTVFFIYLLLAILLPAAHLG